MEKYRNNPGLNKRMPNYDVRLGMGLHMGYCVEGALGSYYKIDPTYLSPHVKMSERLESSTKVFGVPILISEPLWKKLSRKTQQYTRCVDWVDMEGMGPTKLYTIDVNSATIKLEEETLVYMTPREQKLKRIQNRMIRNNLRKDALNGTKQISTVFETNEDLLRMMKPFTPEFRNTYKEAY